jgi:hypothetical protein
MNDVLAPIMKKLAASLRMLSSDHDGDVIAAGRAIVRMLRSAGADIHTLAERVEKPNGGDLTYIEMIMLYDAGYSTGMRDAENKKHGGGDLHNVDGTLHWHEIARFCQQHSEWLGEKKKICHRRCVADDMARAN